MTKLEKLQQMEAMFEGYTQKCSCQQCKNALASIRKWIQEEQDDQTT